MHPSRPRPSRASSIASVDRTAQPSNNNNAALLGATRAFGRPKPGTTTTTPPHRTGHHGAPAASTVGGRGRTTTTTTTTPMTTADGSFSRSALPQPGSMSLSSADSITCSTGGDIMKEKSPVLDLVNMPHLSVPQDGGGGGGGGGARPPHGRSPSQQAALLAATRAHSPLAAPQNEAANRSRAATYARSAAARPAVAPKPRRLSEHIRKIEDTEHASDKPTDTTPIAPTTSLVDLFEQRLTEMQQSEKRAEPIFIKPQDRLAIRSPRPVVPPKSGITSMIQLQYTGSHGGQQAPQRQKGKVKRDSAVSEQHDGHASSSGESYVSASEDLDAQSPAGSSRDHRAKTPSPSPGHVLKEHAHAKRRPPSPSPPPRNVTKPIRIQTQRQPSRAPSESISIHSAKSVRSIPAQYHQANPRRMTPQMSGDQLANAIVASSLASSRAPSPTRLEPPPVPGRHTKYHNHHHHHKLAFSRTPSPAKGGMLHTLRKADDSSSDSDDDPHPYAKHKKKRLVRKHPNKHHEGDRKRWRDAVTDRERKRYEGVWAANKGLHISFTLEEQQLHANTTQHQRTVPAKISAADAVSNIVTRDIWSRSRLPEQALEMVWDLVDNDALGRLQKDEFVVGMWLIDQRLKGRKLPVKVSETVWASVRGISGIKVRK